MLGGLGLWLGRAERGAAKLTAAANRINGVYGGIKSTLKADLSAFGQDATALRDAMKGQRYSSTGSIGARAKTALGSISSGMKQFHNNYMMPTYGSGANAYAGSLLKKGLIGGGIFGAGYLMSGDNDIEALERKKIEINRRRGY